MLTHRLADRSDLDALRAVMDAAIAELQKPAARAEGFRSVELMATMAGEPLYRACGYEPVDRVTDDRGGAPVPLVRMSKRL